MTTFNPQAVVKTRRDYNTWVASETLEDYALRFAPRSFRKWSEFRVANTAFGSVSFLVLEAVGGSLVLNYGFTNALWAILVVGLLIFITGFPISYYAARHNIDMDLLTRGAGFGYLGSTITSLIYATFTFTLFALEAAIMAQALEQYFSISLALAYVISAVVVIPLVVFGVTAINRLQLWTQPLWIVLLIVPYAALLYYEPEQLSALTQFEGRDGAGGSTFDWLKFGTAATVAFSMIAQIGEQVDFLRFLPDKTPANAKRWWAAVIIAGPGWIGLGMLRQLGGALLAVTALQHGVLAEHAHEPAQMYRIAYGYVFDSSATAVTITTIFVVISQIKINVTNAYAGSLAWSNFFSRLTHSHPGRVVWLVFNVMIALLLMEMGVFDRLERILGLLSNVAIAWIGAVFADLIINKPLGLSPPTVEFKRAKLMDLNPVGVVSTLLASVLSVYAYLGGFGQYLQAFAPFLALSLAMLLAVAIALITDGRFYLAQRVPQCEHGTQHGPCCICENKFETEDSVYCPLYQGTICSLCCTLDARCHDGCKSKASLRDQVLALADIPLLERFAPSFRIRMVQFVLTFAVLAAVLTAVLGIIYYLDITDIQPYAPGYDILLYANFVKVYATLLVLIGLGSWGIVLNYESRRVAEAETSKQTSLLLQEIENHRRTDAMLKQAREIADRANQAKSRFLSDMSHELRTPLNSILGYAEILAKDSDIPPRRHIAVHTIQRSGQFLATLIEDILDIARIEARKFELNLAPIRLTSFVDQIMHLFAPQAEAKGLSLRCQILNPLPQSVRGDERRIRQILINLLSNAIKFTRTGAVVLRVGFRGEIARFEITDTGPGIATERLEDIFQPFNRITNTDGNATSGSGLGLTITKLITEIMGGEITVHSTPGAGSTFSVRLFLPELHNEVPEPEPVPAPRGYCGSRKTLLIVDDQRTQSAMLSALLEPLGFSIDLAGSGTECLNKVRNGKYDLVMLDMLMPEIDGLSAARELRILGYQGSIIAVSANAYRKDRDNAIASGCDDFLPKPVQIDRLLDLLQLHMGLVWTDDEHTEARESVALLMPAGTARDDLAKLARMGDLRALLEAVDSLADGDDRFRPLATRVGVLAKDFRLGDIKRLLCETA